MKSLIGTLLVLIILCGVFIGKAVSSAPSSQSLFGKITTVQQERLSSLEELERM